MKGLALDISFNSGRGYQQFSVNPFFRTPEKGPFLLFNKRITKTVFTCTFEIAK